MRFIIIYRGPWAYSFFLFFSFLKYKAIHYWIDLVLRCEKWVKEGFRIWLAPVNIFGKYV